MSPLDAMFNSVEWGDFILGDLFEIENTQGFNKERITLGDEYDYVTRTSQNNGVLMTTGIVTGKKINPAGTWSLGLIGMDFFYRKKPWYAGQYVRKLVPKLMFSEASALWITSTLNNKKDEFLSVLVRNVDEKLRNACIRLPKRNEKIDFDFMEKFIFELERDRLAKLEDYFVSTGLDQCDLTEEEQLIFDEFENFEWKKYKLGDLFEKVTTKKLPFKASELPREKIGDYIIPCLTSSFKNQGLNYFVPKDGVTILKDLISIPSNSDVYRAYFQSNEFTVLSDAYVLRWIFEGVNITPNQYLFLVQSINKVTDLPIYSYKNKLGGWNVVREKFIHLPVKHGNIDYQSMEVLMSALKKLSIKGVVEYVGRKIIAPEKAKDASSN